MSTKKEAVVKRLDFDKEKLRHDEEEKDLKKSYRDALRQIRALEKELDFATALKHNEKTTVIRPSEKRGGSEATAIVLLSDWHVYEVVKSSTVNGMNAYNPEVAKARAEQCFQRILRLVKKEQQDVKIDTILLWLGGDFITGGIHPERNTFDDSVAEALYAKSLLKSGIEFLIEHSGCRVICVCSSGNHARITPKIHISKEYGNSLETFIYCSLRDEIPKAQWVIEQGYNTYLKMYDYMLRFNHGHAVKYAGGIGGVTIPLIKAIKGWDSTKKADFTFLGHHHQYLSGRNFVVNGSMIGFNPYAVFIKADFEPPVQAFFLLDRKRGRTVHIPILFE